MTGIHTALYRLSAGRIGGRVWNADVLLLETKGRRTGARRTTPLMYVRDGEDLVVVGSNGGRPHHPAWYLNLLSEPRVRVRSGAEEWIASARTADPDKKARLWPRVVATYSGYESYRKNTTRDIPLVILRRVDA
jgi:deazaflavin-dependent oxidoreductase (nitroreductase family)